MNAIPTRYASVQFRSRLEARWAAMFDLLGWSWEYEPIDLDGYIPDFVMQFTRPVLVEVKPVMWIRNVGDGNLALIDESAAKIKRSGWTESWIVVGACLGKISETFLMGYGMTCSRQVGQVLTTCWSCRKHTIVDVTAGHRYGCVLYGYDYPEGDKRPAGLPAMQAQALWREAGNRVQWRAPEPTR